MIAWTNAKVGGKARSAILGRAETMNSFLFNLCSGFWALATPNAIMTWRFKECQYLHLDVLVRITGQLGLQPHGLAEMSAGRFQVRFEEGQHIVTPDICRRGTESPMPVLMGAAECRID